MENLASLRASRICGADAQAAGTIRILRERFVTPSKIICDHCGKQGHLARVCFSALRKKAGDNKDKNDGKRPIYAIAPRNDDVDSEMEVWKRLPLSVSHDSGEFTFNSFPDTGSATTLIAANVAKRENMRAMRDDSNTKYINVNG